MSDEIGLSGVPKRVVISPCFFQKAGSETDHPYTEGLLQYTTRRPCEEDGRPRGIHLLLFSPRL